MTVTPVDTAALQAYIDRHFAPGAVSPLDTGATGSSNVTLFFTVTTDGAVEDYVLRTQAGGHQLFLAPEVLFQSRVMRGVAASADLPIPEVVLEEPDESIAGAAFYVMRRIGGRDIPNFPSWQAEGWYVDEPPAARAQLWNNAVTMIARVGRVDWTCELGFLDGAGPGERGLDRYLSWVEEWYAWTMKGRPQPISDVALAYVREHQPVDPPVELVWGDSTIMNMLFDDDLSVSAVLDWEMAALGPAELDLGWFLFMGDMYSTGFGLPRLEGLPTRDDDDRAVRSAARTRARPPTSATTRSSARCGWRSSVPDSPTSRSSTAGCR